MADKTLDELGPVDYLIVEFPAGQQNFTGEGVDELLRLHDAGIIRVMDMLILVKDEDGSVEATRDLRHGRARRAAAARGRAGRRRWPWTTSSTSPRRWIPARVAGVLVYENVWAAPFASAMRRAGGQLIANGRIPIQAIIAAVEADEAEALETAGV